MIDPKIVNTFRKGSRTYFISSIFFPRDVMYKIFTLYAFVRTADNFVDQIPQDVQGFHNFKKNYTDAINGIGVGDVIITSFVSLMKTDQIKKEWVESFLKAMEMDIHKNNYINIRETEEYMYGSAEVIGLMMAKILKLPEKSYKYAKLLGKAMQFANFIRDIQIDIDLGRNYFPNEDLMLFKLDSLNKKDIIKNKNNFVTFVRKQISLYFIWQKEAEKGFCYIPKRYLVPIKTASEMYKWTIVQINKDPLIVLTTQLKPSRSRIIFTGIKNFLEFKRGCK